MVSVGLFEELLDIRRRKTTPSLLKDAISLVFEQSLGIGE